MSSSGSGAAPEIRSGSQHKWKHADRTCVDRGPGLDRPNLVSCNGPGDSRNPGCAKTRFGSGSDGDRPSVLVGIPLSEIWSSHSQRTPYSRKRSSSTNANILEIAVGRHRPQFLNPAIGRQDRPYPQSHKRNVDGSEVCRRLLGAMRAVLRDTARKNVATCDGRNANGIRRMDPGPTKGSYFREC